MNGEILDIAFVFCIQVNQFDYIYNTTYDNTVYIALVGITRDRYSDDQNEWKQIKPTFSTLLACTELFSITSRFKFSSFEDCSCFSSFLVNNISFNSSIVFSWFAMVTQANKWLTVIRKAYNNARFTTNNGTSMHFVYFSSFDFMVDAIYSSNQNMQAEPVFGAFFGVMFNGKRL